MDRSLNLIVCKMPAFHCTVDKICNHQLNIILKSNKGVTNNKQPTTEHHDHHVKLDPKKIRV